MLEVMSAESESRRRTNSQFRDVPANVGAGRIRIVNQHIHDVASDAGDLRDGLLQLLGIEDVGLDDMDVGAFLAQVCKSFSCAQVADNSNNDIGRRGRLHTSRVSRTSLGAFRAAYELLDEAELSHVCQWEDFAARGISALTPMPRAAPMMTQLDIFEGLFVTLDGSELRGVSV
jgi:hypothetical protein